jgi:hypothetical protein
VRVAILILPVVSVFPKYSCIQGFINGGTFIAKNIAGLTWLNGGRVESRKTKKFNQ